MHVVHYMQKLPWQQKTSWRQSFIYPVGGRNHILQVSSLNRHCHNHYLNSWVDFVWHQMFGLLWMLIGTLYWWLSTKLSVCWRVVILIVKKMNMISVFSVIVFRGLMRLECFIHPRDKNILCVFFKWFKYGT